MALGQIINGSEVKQGYPKTKPLVPEDLRTSTGPQEMCTKAYTLMMIMFILYKKLIVSSQQTFCILDKKAITVLHRTTDD